MKFFFYFSILMIFFQLQAFAALNYNSFIYRVENGDSLGDIIKKFVKDPTVIKPKSRSLKKSREANPNIIDWKVLRPGAFVQVLIDVDIFDQEKYNAYEKKIEAIVEDLASGNTRPTGFKYSAFFTSSIGTFKQSSGEVASITSKQNSPITLGLAGAYYPEGSSFSTAGSFYFSTLLPATNNQTTEQIAIPPEIGLNVYEEYYWKRFNLLIYSGLDYESFSAINLRTLRNSGKVYMDKGSSISLSLGVIKHFSMFEKKFFTKFSISKSMAMTITDGGPWTTLEAPIDSKGKFSGMRILGYLCYKYTEKFYFHGLLKIHKITGPSELSIFRMGLGINYNFK